MTVLCDYCGGAAKLVGGEVIYPHRPDLAELKFWHCAPCRAYVGCHRKNKKHGQDGMQPLGRLASDLTDFRHDFVRPLSIVVAELKEKVDA